MPTVRRLTLRILVLAVLAAPVLCRAQEVCPWLNAATAGGVLEGLVTVKVARTGGGVACDFARQKTSLVFSLRIEVAAMRAPQADFGAYKQRCGNDIRIFKAVGNEAIACTLAEADGQLAEQVVGRVRNQAFVILLSTNDSAMHSSMRDKIRRVAEQIAGNLF